jgi:membrane protease YdiL (CAAX protease family)
MGLKGIYADKSSASKVGILFFLIFVSVILHTLLAVVLVALFADNGMALIQNQDLSNQASINYLKLMQLFSGVGLFITPTLLYAYLTNFEFKFFKLSRQNTLLAIAIMLLITPFIGLLLEWNMMIPAPEWLLQFDINSEAFVTAFLQMSNIWGLLFTLLVLAIVPAIGEELLFRGYLQQKLGNWLSNPHTAILITAFLFSAIHFHFKGMIPRFVLGVLLGYLFYWSNSLWLPILAHFVNNAQAVILSYPSFKIDSGAYSVSPESSVDPIMGLFSFMSVSLLLYLLYQNISIKKG